MDGMWLIPNHSSGIFAYNLREGGLKPDDILTLPKLAEGERDDGTYKFTMWDSDLSIRAIRGVDLTAAVDTTWGRTF